MSAARQAAERCFVSTCAALALMRDRGETFQMWVSILREITPDCMDHPPVMRQLWYAADELIQATGPREINNRMSRLEVEVAEYFLLAAAARYEAWRNAVASQAAT